MSLFSTTQPIIAHDDAPAAAIDSTRLARPSLETWLVAQGWTAKNSILLLNPRFVVDLDQMLDATPYLAH